MKICDFCSNEFTIMKAGSGGTNRRYCYICFPDGLNRVDRNNLRNSLLNKKNIEYKESIGCSCCGYNKYGGALDWHHSDGDKEVNPSAALMRSWDKYIEETNKCVLLCANCHREAHR